jgi:hypothetical protein
VVELTERILTSGSVLEDRPDKATAAQPMIGRVLQWLGGLDQALLRAPRAVRTAAFVLTAIVMAATALPHVPRQIVNFEGLPILSGLQRHDTYGNDTIGDGYEARVVLNDWRDMYTKAKVEMTPLEAATWSKEASAPYPPAVLLAEAGLYALGDWSGIGFYGVMLTLAIVFVVASARYFLKTRWYLFPALYLNFVYFGGRFVYVQDCSYLVVLTVLIAALYLARRRHPASHALVALGTAMKLSPLYYAVNLGIMRRRDAAIYLAILVAGFVLPYFVWENYLYIFQYSAELKGDWNNAVAALLVVMPFALVLRYVETRLPFDWEDRLGWGLVPVALLLALKMNVARHLLIMLLVPDKRGIRNIAAATGLAVPVIFGVPFNSSLGFAVLVLVAGLTYYLREIGWERVRRDLRTPRETLRDMFWSGPQPA